MTDTLPELSVQSFAACEVADGFRLVGAPVSADTIYLVLAGTMHMRLPVGRVTAKAGSMVLVPAEQQPGVSPLPGPAIDVIATRNCLLRRGGLLVLDAAHGGTGTLRLMVGRVGSGVVPLLQRADRDGPHPTTLDLSDAPLARRAYATLLAELDAPERATPDMTTALMKACFVLFVRAAIAKQDGAAPASPPPETRLARIVAQVRARPGAAYSVEAMAQLAGMSRATLARQFQRHLGMTPMEFVLQARLHDAAARLRGGSLSIKQVAADSGFQSRSHFSRAFQEEFGRDPKRFRAETATGASMFEDGGD